MRRGLPLFAFALAGAALLWLGVVVAGRVAFPFPLEWMEGGVRMHVARVLAGEALYGPPAPAFTPYVYMPGAYLVMALPAMLLGHGFVVLRAVSLCALAVVLFSLFRIARRHAHRAAAGALGVAFFALGFGYAGAFMDLARVDAIWLACLCAGAERMQAGRNRSGLGWLAAAVVVKQQALLMFVGTCAWLCMRGGRHALRPALPAALTLGVVLGVWTWRSDGWFWFYTFTLPAAQGLEPTLLLSFFAVDVALYLPVLAVVAVLAWLRRSRSPGVLDVMVVVALLMGALGRAHPGGHDNVRLPALAFLCALSAGELMRRARCASSRGRLTIAVLAAAQAGILYQPVALHRPSPASAAGFAALTGAIADCGGRGPDTVAAPDFG